MRTILIKFEGGRCLEFGVDRIGDWSFGYLDICKSGSLGFVPVWGHVLGFLVIDPNCAGFRVLWI